MANPLFTFIELTWSIILAIIILILIPFIKLEGEKSLKINLIYTSFIINLKNIHAIRLLLLLFGIILVCLPAFKDYSKLFPTHLKMEVFFDDEGINKSLKDFTDEDLLELNISKNWGDEKKEYIDKLNNDVYEYLSIKDFFSLSEGINYSIGQTSFISEKIKGWQTYCIKEASGFLNHYAERPNNPRRQFYSIFELIYSNNNYINVSLLDIYVNHKKLLKPKFKQIAVISPTMETPIFHHILIAATKITFMPIARISNTIYLVYSNKLNQYVPIGYAVYKPI